MSDLNVKRLVVASGNKHKIEEIRAILADFDFEILSMSEAGLKGLEIEETGSTFEENAEIKAQAVFERLDREFMVLADDSGLAVDYLDGAPGIFSARYSGAPHDDHRNNLKLLEMLKDVPESLRSAQFVSCIVLLMPTQRPIVVRGVVKGRILDAFRGSNGFGYDPLFYIPELGQTMAELTAEEKNQYSHRSKALAALKERLEIER